MKTNWKTEWKTLDGKIASLEPAGAMAWFGQKKDSASVISRHSQTANQENKS